MRLSAEGLLARVIQHEIDHLFGKLIVDYLNPLKKICKGTRRHIIPPQVLNINLLV
ncbi:MAG: peptide deformylase [Candidatus Omnitrophota bacterium]|nr:peptide deformylase [Candidatus Omnitrophota bacterium]